MTPLGVVTARTRTVPGLLLSGQARGEFPSCGCRSCCQGVLIAGHCVDIDGDYWHDCAATRSGAWADGACPGSLAPTLSARPDTDTETCPVCGAEVQIQGWARCYAAHPAPTAAAREGRPT